MSKLHVILVIKLLTLYEFSLRTQTYVRIAESVWMPNNELKCFRTRSVKRLYTMLGSAFYANLDTLKF